MARKKLTLKLNPNFRILIRFLIVVANIDEIKFDTRTIL